MMRRYAASMSQHPVPAHAVGEAAGEILEALGGDDPDLLVCFVSPHFVGTFEDVAHALAGIFDPRVLLGMTAVSIVGGAREVEDCPALSLFAARFDDAVLTPVSLSVQSTPDGSAVVGWPELDHEPSTLLLLADPFSFPVDGFLRALRADHPGLQVIGGVASAARGPGGNRLLLDTESLAARHDASPAAPIAASEPGAEGAPVRAAGAVGVLLDGVEVRTVVSQGCRPIGQPVRGHPRRPEPDRGARAVDRRSIACRTARAVAERRRPRADAPRAARRAGRRRAPGRLRARRLPGAQRDRAPTRETGRASRSATRWASGRRCSSTCATRPPPTRTSASCSPASDAAAALLFTCNGRGAALFGVPDHDAGLVDRLLGPLPVAGAFCAGEIGPVGGQNFLHGFTASLALFR